MISPSKISDPMKHGRIIPCPSKAKLLFCLVALLGILLLCIRALAVGKSQCPNHRRLGKERLRQQLEEKADSWCWMNIEFRGTRGLKIPSNDDWIVQEYACDPNVRKIYKRDENGFPYEWCSGKVPVISLPLEKCVRTKLLNLQIIDAASNGRILKFEHGGRLAQWLEDTKSLRIVEDIRPQQKQASAAGAEGGFRTMWTKWFNGEEADIPETGSKQARRSFFTEFQHVLRPLAGATKKHLLRLGKQPVVLKTIVSVLQEASRHGEGSFLGAFLPDIENVGIALANDENYFYLNQFKELWSNKQVWGQFFANTIDQGSKTILGTSDGRNFKFEFAVMMLIGFYKDMINTLHKCHISPELKNEIREYLKHETRKRGQELYLQSPERLKTLPEKPKDRKAFLEKMLSDNFQMLDIIKPTVKGADRK